MKNSSKVKENVKMIKAVILAAGRGKRISAHMNNKPKPLIPIFGKTLIEYPLEALKENGIEECVIVVGYKAEKIREYLSDGEKYGLKIEYVYNPEFDDGNGVSLYHARQLLDENEPFLVLMADHLVDSEIIGKALQNIENKPLLCIDYSPKYPPQLKDATRVLINTEGYVRDIGKELTEWNGVDTGVFILDKRIFEAIEKVKEKTRASLSKCIKRMISDGVRLWACNVSELFWLDIDLPEDLEFAKKTLAEMKTFA